MTRLFAGTPFDQPPKCDRCGELESDCQCPPVAEEPLRIAPEKQTAKVRVERRKHKRLITVVSGLDPAGNDLKEILSNLQSACGAGGSLKEGQIEVQGDHAERAREVLRLIGYRVK